MQRVVLGGRLTLIKWGAISVSARPSPLIQLSTLFARSIPLVVQVESQIGNVYASGALLARFKSGDGQLDFPGQHLALEHDQSSRRSEQMVQKWYSLPG
jgi:hypothetical protein